MLTAVNKGFRRVIGVSMKTKLLASGLAAAAMAVAWIPLHAATAVATVDASIISTLSIATRTGLGFGDISAGVVSGSVVMTPAGTRTSTGGASVNTATAASAASFDLTGTPNASFTITLPASVVLSDGTNSMLVDNFTSSPTPTGVLDGSGQQTLYVGATLNVEANQPFGDYSGQMAVTVEYN